MAEKKISTEVTNNVKKMIQERYDLKSMICSNEFPIRL